MAPLTSKGQISNVLTKDAQKRKGIADSPTRNQMRARNNLSVEDLKRMGYY
jgi:hypothetical protein